MAGKSMDVERMGTSNWSNLVVGVPVLTLVVVGVGTALVKAQKARGHDL